MGYYGIYGCMCDEKMIKFKCRDMFLLSFYKVLISRSYV